MAEIRYNQRTIYQKYMEWDHQYEVYMGEAPDSRIRSMQFEYGNSSNYPHHAFLVCTNETGEMRITFLDEKDQPFLYAAERPLESVWYQIDPSKAFLFNAYNQEMCLSMIQKDEMAGYLIPLYESEELQSPEEIENYQRNLSFWESLIKADGYPVPSEIRHMWIVTRQYKLRDHISKVQQALGDLRMPTQQGTSTYNLLRNLFSNSETQREQGLQKLYEIIVNEAQRSLFDKDEKTRMKRVLLEKKLQNLMANQQITTQRVRILERDISDAQKQLEKCTRCREDYVENLNQIDKEISQTRKELNDLF